VVGGWRAPGLLPAMQAAAALGSYTAITVLLWGLLLALLIFRRLRQLLVVLLAWTLQGFLIQYVVAPLVERPRPFGVEFRTDWYAWALPSEQMAALVVLVVGILYGPVPEGRWRQTGKWVVATLLVALIAVAHVYLGVETPTDVLLGVAIGVAIPLLCFRVFTPSQIFPVGYRGGTAAHLDVSGARGQAIRRALHDQLGLVVEQPTSKAHSPPRRPSSSGSPVARHSNRPWTNAPKGDSTLTRQSLNNIHRSTEPARLATDVPRAPSPLSRSAGMSAAPSRRC
jgi:membrane-associated phospholipid phosphatase